ncbi:ATP-binding cassette domain-containing protein [Allosaccharopolyspora coralli]|uniref:ATP-binding cassette domain-containing protein n=1 Tax=Allosaccharopolyspora coralli TaxID=2665642 RepID=A0A5Q3Q9R4_9PSEU|nr:ABC-F family ATP-binding cassette domain-containing protein [Allosaccharopolyspora coralli]QGK69944.1 ATP-binding cassette domain-containing protein [Allosaccharopolyspora coralli]
MSPAPLLVSDLTKTYEARRVLDGVSLTAAPGTRLGLVGDNGVGKSTLLRLLAGLEAVDSGEISGPAEIGYLHQELPFSAKSTVTTVIDDALADLRAAETRLSTLAEQLADNPHDALLLDEYGQVWEWAQHHELWDADRRAELVLDGLGLAGVTHDRRLDRLSGGQRSRLGLAALLVRRPATLLLDEPTNHLDDDALEFLEQHLPSLPGAVILASHDRVFLDAVCTDIVDLDPSVNGTTRYGGTFSDYVEAKRAERARWEQRHRDEQAELAALRHSVDVTARQVSNNKERGNTSKLAYDYKGARVQKQVSRRVRNAQQRLDELTRTQVRKPPKPLSFSASLTSDAVDGEVAVQLRDTTVVGRLHVAELDIAGADQLLVTGPNGAGKSTLLHLLAGTLPPQRGGLHRRSGLSVGMLEQDVVFADDTVSPRHLYAEAVADHSDAPALHELGLLAGRDLDRPVGVLSVGQRRRVALARLLARPPQVLLLDEPTNHLSLALAGELEDALHSAPGATVVATHDRWLRRRWDGRALELRNGHLHSD